MFEFNFEKAVKNTVMFKREFGTSLESFGCILDFINCWFDKSKCKQGRKPSISNCVKLCCFWLI